MALSLAELMILCLLVEYLLQRIHVPPAHWDVGSRGSPWPTDIGIAGSRPNTDRLRLTHDCAHRDTLACWVGALKRELA